MYARQFEDQHAPEQITLALRAGADEIERLRAGGCARDQSTTQYCGEAAKKDAEIASLLNLLADARTESMKLRAALAPFAKAADGFDMQRINNPEEWFAYGGIRGNHETVGAITVGDLRRARAALEGK